MLRLLTYCTNFCQIVEGTRCSSAKIYTNLPGENKLQLKAVQDLGILPVVMRHWFLPLGAWMLEQTATSSQMFTKQLWIGFIALLNGTSVVTGVRTRTLLLTTPELESVELGCSAMAE